jgi:hypothetical protein
MLENKLYASKLTLQLNSRVFILPRQVIRINMMVIDWDIMNVGGKLYGNSNFHRIHIILYGWSLEIRY